MRRTIILFFIALALVAVIALFAFFLSPQNGGESGAGAGGGNIFGNLFPFGDESAGTTLPPGGEAESADTRPVPALRRVTEKPASGGYVYQNGVGETMIRYIERETGHLFQTPAEGRGVVRISNTTIPGIQEVLFAHENGFIIRYLNEDGGIENFYASLKAGAEDQTIGGKFLDSWERGNIDAIGKNLLTVAETPSGSSVIVSGVDGTNKRTVLVSPIRSWVPLQSDTNMYVYSAPAAGVSGSLYQISNNALRKVAGDIAGMVALVSPSGRYVLASGGESDVSLFLFDTQNGQRYESPVATLAVKCVFVKEAPVKVACGVPNTFPAGEYPNDWLLGRVQFDDDLWLIEPTNGVATLVALPFEDTGYHLDVWQPVADKTGSYVGFIDKNNLSFWSLRLEKPAAKSGTESE